MAGNNNSNGTGTSLLDLEGRPESDFAPLLGHWQKARLVTIEDHAVTPFPTPTVSSTLGIFKPQYMTELKKRLGDVELRLRIMDANGIGAQVISLNQPTAQAFVDLEAYIDFCCKANDFVYETYCQRHPTRFFAFATLPTQDGSAAAEELERCVERYDFVGAMVNGFTNTVQDMMPFGVGLRACLGNNLAMQEIHEAVRVVAASNILEGATTIQHQIKMKEWFNGEIIGHRLEIKWC